jgi:hypothetical protein
MVAAHCRSLIQGFCLNPEPITYQICLRVYKTQNWHGEAVHGAMKA